MTKAYEVTPRTGDGKACKLRPLGDRIAVIRDEPEGKSKGGILLPESAKETPKRGKVVAVGDGRLMEDGSRAAIEVAVGDTVVFMAYAGSDVKIDDQDYLVLAVADCVAVLD